MMLCRPATFVGIVGLLAALAGCRGKGAPAEERSRAVPPEWIGLDATLVDAGIPGLPDVSVASLVPGEPSQQDGGSALAVVPLDLPPPPPAPLAVGERHACWIRPDERVVCWGANDAGQVNGRPGPVLLSLPQDVLEGSVPGDHARIARWRREQIIQRTLERRPELLNKANLGLEDKKLVERLISGKSQPNNK